MSMHLAGPYLTTTSYKKRTEKITKAKQEELERGWRERNIRLKQMGLPKETFEQYTDWIYGRGKKVARQKGYQSETPKANAKVYQASSSAQGSSGTLHNVNNQNDSQSKDAEVVGKVDNGTHGKIWVTGACTTKPTPTYTGTKIIGIGTMHKSNAVPIFSDEEAKDISSMRR